MPSTIKAPATAPASIQSFGRSKARFSVSPASPAMIPHLLCQVQFHINHMVLFKILTHVPVDSRFEPWVISANPVHFSLREDVGVHDIGLDASIGGVLGLPAGLGRDVHDLRVLDVFDIDYEGREQGRCAQGGGRAPLMLVEGALPETDDGTDDGANAEPYADQRGHVYVPEMDFFRSSKLPIPIHSIPHLNTASMLARLPFRP